MLPLAHAGSSARVMTYVSQPEGSSHYRIMASSTRKGASRSPSAASELIQEFSLQQASLLGGPQVSTQVLTQVGAVQNLEKSPLCCPGASTVGNICVILSQDILLYNFGWLVPFQ